MVGLDIDNVHPHIPFAEGAIFEAGVGGVVDLENEERDEFGKQPRWRAREFGAALGQTEFALEVPPKAQRDQKLVQHL
jgi:hypothetical protein